MLTAALAAVALLAGLTGTWSPCGFSMIETIGGGRRVVGSCVTFTLGAAAGAVATFGLAAAVGAGLHGLGEGWIASVAPVVAVAAGIGEVRGLAIAPQVRRQVPEHWRRRLPLPLAAGLYGVLLGLAFTTFILSFAVWALLAVVVALGSPALGLVVGLAFGVGRALPIAVVAPFARRRVGLRVLAAMAERPAILRAVRVVDGGALLVAAVAMMVTSAAATNLGEGTDPSAAGDLVTWTTPAGGVAIREGQPGETAVPAHAVVGGALIAWRDGELVHVAQAVDMAPVLEVAVPGVDAVAVSDTWLVTRVRSGGDTLTARPIAAPDQVQTIGRASGSAQLGRPALDGDVLVYHVARPSQSQIVEQNLTTSTSRVVRRSSTALLTNPALLGGQLLYVRQTDLAQLLEVGPLATKGRDHVLYRLNAPAVHDQGHERGYSHKTRTPHPRTAAWTLWTTALSSTRAYVTLLPRKTGASPRIVAVAR